MNSIEKNKKIKIREANIFDIEAITRIYNYIYNFRRENGEFYVQKCH